MIRETIEGRRSREDIQFGVCTKMVNALHAAWITGDPSSRLILKFIND